MLRKKTLVGLGALTLVALFAGTVQAALMNGTFEIPNVPSGSSGEVFGSGGGWFSFGNVFTQSNEEGRGPVSHDAGGTQTLKMFGLRFNPAGVSQSDNTVVAGQSYQLEAWAMNYAPDPFQGIANIGILQLQFWDGPNGTGVQLGGNVDAFLFPYVPDPPKPLHFDLSAEQGGTQVSDWTRIALTATAPLNTQSATVYLLHVNDSLDERSALRWDDVSLTAVPTSVPAPATIWLLGTALIGAGVIKRRNMKA